MSQVRINGQIETLPQDPDTMLIDMLRGKTGLTGTKLACGAGVCGACTVLLDGVPVVSCLLPAGAAGGKSVTTVEGIGAQCLHPVQKAFMALDALQCGFCTPGFVVEAVAFHDAWRKANGAAMPSRQEIGAALSGHLCRCGAYANILRAVAEACAGRFDSEDVATHRIEARAKVTGAAHYTVDIRHDGQLEGLILRSRVAHARIVELDLAPALAMPGIKAAVPLLGKEKIVRFVGEPIAAVAATDRKTARAALDAIKVVSESLPSVIGLDAARRPEAPLVFPKSKKNAGDIAEGTGGPAPWKRNVRGPSSAFSHKAKKARQWVAAAREAQDALLVEGTFRTAAQSHSCLEPHATVARFDGDRLTLHVSTQAVSHLRDLVAKKFKLDRDKVRVIADHVGGGFGSKAVVGSDTFAAVALARAAGAPVCVVFDRQEEQSVTGYRPAAEIKLSLLPTRDGGLKALSFDAYADTGAAVNSTIAGLARLIYPAEAKHLADFDVVSNLPPGCPFRGPGGPPMAFALEQAVDEAALRLKLDPIALRRRWDPNPNRHRLYDWAAGLDLWRNAASVPQTGRFRRGVGVAAGYWLYLWELGSTVDVAIENHRVVASVAVQDIGTGSRTVIANTVARDLGLDPEEIEVRIGDSALPHGPASGGSRTTASIVPPLLAALQKLKDEIRRNARAMPAPGSNAPWRALIAASPDLRVTATRAEDEKPTIPGITSPIRDVGIIGMVFGWMMRRFSKVAIGAGVPSCVQVIEVEVDTWLGHVRVLNVHTGIAVGKIAAYEPARSQAAGSVIQGIGYALYEAREVDPQSGHILTGGLEDYRLPGIADTPAIDVHFDEGGFDHVAGGSVGIGEVATLPTSAAIANAIRHAIGMRPYELPIRPDRLLHLLNRKEAV